MKKFLTLLLFTFHTSFLFAQKEGNMWYFGDSAGVDFNSIIPVPILNGLTFTEETSSTICDKDGNLLFYTGSVNPNFYDNITIWNKNSNIIQNGTGLKGGSTFTQGTLLLPDPQNNNSIYLFHIINSGLYYSKIDKNCDNGNGCVIIKNKLLLNDSITEKMVAVRHANGRDWWIIVHDGNNNTFIMYILQKDTILGPFEQSLGSIHTDPMGQMCISKDGSKLVCVTHNGIIDFFDFDRCIGLLSNWHKLGDIISEYYGCCFSPDNSKLYITTFRDSYSIFPILYQFDVNSSNIPSTKTIIFGLNKLQAFYGQLNVGIDNKIYIVKCSGTGWPNSVYDTNNMFLSIIEQPDLPGNSCQFILNGLFLGGKRTEAGLPNIPNYALGKIANSQCDTIPEEIPPIDTLPVYYIPNIFSPNKDGQNDKFLIRGEKIKDIHLKIFNRWGNVVFETYYKSEGWDGYFKGSRCEEGVYIYKVEIQFLDGKAISRNGNVTLIR